MRKSSAKDHILFLQAIIVAGALFLYHFYELVGPYVFFAIMVGPWIIAIALLYVRDQHLKKSGLAKLFAKFDRQEKELREKFVEAIAPKLRAQLLGSVAKSRSQKTTDAR